MAIPTASEWLVRAEEARQLADILRDVGARYTMLTIASGYEKMARHAALLGDTNLPMETGGEKY